MDTPERGDGATRTQRREASHPEASLASTTHDGATASLLSSSAVRRQRQQKPADYFYSEIPFPSPPPSARQASVHGSTPRETYGGNTEREGATSGSSSSSVPENDDEEELRVQIRRLCVAVCERVVERQEVTLAHRERALQRREADAAARDRINTERLSLFWRETLEVAKRHHQPAEAAVKEILDSLDSIEKELGVAKATDSGLRPAPEG